MQNFDVDVNKRKDEHTYKQTKKWKERRKLYTPQHTLYARVK